MKNTLMKTLLFGGIILTLNACKKEGNSSKSKSRNYNTQALSREEDPEEIAYDNVIDAVTYGLVDLSKEEEFKRIVNAEVEKQFDGDDNVLLLTLNSILEVNGRNFHNEMVACLTKYGHEDLKDYVEPAINGLAYNGTKIYSQVFIPFIEDKNLNDDVVAICANKNDDDVLPGVSVTSDGGLEALDIKENFAIAELLWVISMNESVDATGSVTDRKSINNSNGGKPTAAGDRFLKIDKIYINEKKEGWGNGRADISHITLILRWCSQNDLNFGVFCKLANGDLRKWYTPTYQSGDPKILSNVTGPYDAEWEEQYTEDLFTLIYERDLRAKFGQSHVFNNCTGETIYFESKETPYGEIHPRFWDFPGSASNPSYKTESPKSGADGSFELYGYKL